MAENQWKTINPGGKKRVVVTRGLPGSRWLTIFTGADCAVDVGELTGRNIWGKAWDQLF